VHFLDLKNEFSKIDEKSVGEEDGLMHNNSNIMTTPQNCGSF